MSLLIKICGLHNREDVAAAVDAGAGAVGFVFAESVRRVTPGIAKAAAHGLPPEVLRVAVMRHPSNAEWQQVLAHFCPDVLQTDAEDFATLTIPGCVARWPVLREGSATLDDALPETFLYEGNNSGAGETVNWNRAREFSQCGKLILAGGLDRDNVGDAIRLVRPYGVDVSSAVESRPGQKSATMIREFIDAARAAEIAL